MLMVVPKRIWSVDALRELLMVLVLPVVLTVQCIGRREVTGESVMVTALWPVIVAAFALRFVGAVLYGVGDGVRGEIDRWLR